jgi:hypothetical protein
MLMVEEMMTGSTAVSDDSAKATEEFGAESARQASTPPAGHAPAPAPPTPSDQVKDFVDTAPDFMGTDPLKKDTESR